MLRSSSRVSFLSSVLTNEAIVTNATRSLKADMPVGTSAFIPHGSHHLSPT